MKTEYFFWGIKPGEKEETLLTETVNGKVVTDAAFARRVVKIFEGRGCKKVRIQKLDYSEPFDFTKTITSKP